MSRAPINLTLRRRLYWGLIWIYRFFFAFWVFGTMSCAKGMHDQFLTLKGQTPEGVFLLIFFVMTPYFLSYWFGWRFLKYINRNLREWAELP